MHGHLKFVGYDTRDDPWVDVVNALSTLADIYTNTEAINACISATMLADCAPIIQMLFDLNDVEVSHEFEILRSEGPTHETLQKEPSVKYRYASQHSRTPPA